MLTIKHNFIKISLFLGLSLVLACGRVIIADPTPSFTPPAVTSVDILPSNRVKVSWYFDAYQEPLVTGFRLERSENNSKFQVLSDDITPNQRSIELAEPFRGGKVSFRLLSKQVGKANVLAMWAYTPNRLWCWSITVVAKAKKSKSYHKKYRHPSKKNLGFSFRLKLILSEIKNIFHS